MEQDCDEEEENDDNNNRKKFQSESAHERTHEKETGSNEKEREGLVIFACDLPPWSRVRGLLEQLARLLSTSPTHIFFNMLSFSHGHRRRRAGP